MVHTNPFFVTELSIIKAYWDSILWSKMTLSNSNKSTKKAMKSPKPLAVLTFFSLFCSMCGVTVYHQCSAESQPHEAGYFCSQHSTKSPRKRRRWERTTRARSWRRSTLQRKTLFIFRKNNAWGWVFPECRLCICSRSLFPLCVCTFCCVFSFPLCHFF